MDHRRLRREEYTVGWVCAFPVELAAAQEMLDEEHEDLEGRTITTHMLSVKSEDTTWC